MKRNVLRLWLAGTTVGAITAYAAWKHRHLFLVHDVTAGESREYPHLRSRVYYAAPAAVLAAAAQAVRALPGWRAARPDLDNDALDITVKHGWRLPADEITVYVTPESHSQSRAVIRARSRIRLGDFGRNAAHIRALQDAMDRLLTRDAAI